MSTVWEIFWIWRLCASILWDHQLSTIHSQLSTRISECAGSPGCGPHWHWTGGCFGTRKRGRGQRSAPRDTPSMRGRGSLPMAFRSATSERGKSRGSAARLYSSSWDKPIHPRFLISKHLLKTPPLHHSTTPPLTALSAAVHESPQTRHCSKSRRHRSPSPAASAAR